MDELMREFLIESQEGLDRMEQCLTALEERPKDTALLADIFRSVHTIKGTTGFLGFKNLERLAHSGENVLGLLREGKMAAEPAVITLLLQLLDGLRMILKTIEATEQEGEDGHAALIGKLDMLFASCEERSEELQCAKKHAAAAVSARAELVVEAPPDERAKAGSEAGGESLPEPDEAQQAARAKPVVQAAESTLRVDVTLLNRMMNLVGELVLTRNQVLQATSADPNMTLLSRRLDMVTADLRESVMKARMQPVSNIFSKMPRIVRDLAQSLGKKARVQMEGQETELDKSLLEAIKDPLTHAVRNSLDHGIELSEKRRELGKDPEGMLKLKASQEGSHVLIEISDDGAGIPVEKIKAKAIERGLVKPERAAQMNERELMQLIFLPGFSTAASVTNVSGRGVGMDVVRTNVEKIGGKVELDSKLGKGTTVRMRIPLTLAIIPALIVRGMSQSFALPQGALSELVHIARSEVKSTIEWIEDAPLYRLRGKLLPLIYLDRLLMPGMAKGEELERDNFIAVLNADGREYGLVVDGLADPEEIVVKPLSTVLKGIGLYSGATVLGNGELALILDPGAIAMKAGISMGDEQRLDEQEAAGDSMGGMEYLLVAVAGRQAAVPLGDVIRIEQLPLSRIEYVGYRAVLNFEGQLLPVEDSGGLLNAEEGNSDRTIIVVVCRAGNRHVGIAVSHVLDVASGKRLFEAGSEQRAEGVTLLKNRVTGIVDLGAVPSLPVDSSVDATADIAMIVE